jgi:protocatechuate 3,4-dioxygenase beta subunit
MKQAEDEPVLYLTEENSIEAVLARMKNSSNPRFHQIMTSVITHLHEAVKEIKPTQEEWFEAIQFLTRTGHMCTDRRQEWILLSDVLGVSMLVDAINHRKPSGATETTVLGPFYVSGAPRLALGDNICLDGKGMPVMVSGRVNDTEGRPIAGATLDVWMTNEDGFYDVQQPGIQPDMNLRGLFCADGDGKYWFRAARPRYYPIPGDGTVGRLLELSGRHNFRPGHLHFIVSAPGYESVTTHYFDRKSPYLDSDAVFGVKESLIIDFEDHDDPTRAAELGLGNPFAAVTMNFVLVPSR